MKSILFTLLVFVVSQHSRCLAQELNFHKALQPTSEKSVFKVDGHLVWCGSMVKGDDGKYYLFYSRWPERSGHLAWVTESEVALAVSDSPLGPYKHVKVVLGKRDKKFWDADVTHNPTVHKFNGLYYLYYTGNYGTGKFWDNRNHQRIGVAVSKSPQGPWKRSDKPIIDVDTVDGQSLDYLMTANPAICQTPDGKYVMTYKCVSNGPMPFGGKVSHKVAFADTPTGPFIKHKQPVFNKDSVKFAAEDPYIWYQHGKYWALVKDMGGYFTKAGISIALFESPDAINWRVAKNALVSTLEIPFEEGLRKVVKFERPQLYFEDNVPKVLFAAVMVANEFSYNIAIPLKFE